MSNYYQEAKHPITGVVENAEWIDDYFGRHRYGVRFSDGTVYSEDQIRTLKENQTLPPQEERKMKTKLKLYTTAFIAILSLLVVACNAECQEVGFPTQYIDEDALVQRVDDLTETVNTHTDQIAELDERLKALETQPLASPAVKRNLLGTELKKPKSLGSAGTSTPLLNTGSVGSSVQSFTGPAYGSTGLPPAVVSSPVFYEYPAVNSYPMASPAQQFVSTRTVRVPVHQTRTTNVEYGPVLNSRGPVLSRRLGGRLSGGISGYDCSSGVCVPY